MKAFMFPGQGAQAKGMGADLFDIFADMTARADDILGYSIKQLCVDDPDDHLILTQYTQPALYVVNAYSFFKAMADGETPPDFAAGHSLGEYNALLAAGAFDFETGLKLVKKRGELMGQAVGGGMAAVIGLSEAQIGEVLAANDLGQLDVANFNSPFQIVISGPKVDIDRAEAPFEAAGSRMYSKLKVSAAFHSRYMVEARAEFAGFLDGFTFAPLKLPVIANKTARPYRDDQIKLLLADQITHSVRWTDSIRYLMGKGVEEYKEIGSGKTLTGLNRRILREAEPLILADDSEPGVTHSNTAAPGQSLAAPRAAASDGTRSGDGQTGAIRAENLGSKTFRKVYGLRYAYVAGSMYKGIASKELALAMGRAGMIGYVGTGGLNLTEIEDAILFLKKNLTAGQSYGMNLLNNPEDEELVQKTVDLFIGHGVRNIEAAAYIQMTPSLVYLRLKGVHRGKSGQIVSPVNLIAKVSRPEVAESFMSPAPERIVAKLVASGKLSEEEAQLGRAIPMSHDLCVEADSGGHTDQGVAYALMPAMLKLRDDMMRTHGYAEPIRLGAAGGIGTPEAAAAAFILGADFILTGSINQCSVEAGTSDAVKDMLQSINVQDTDYAPAGDMFELGARVQVLKKGVFFPTRANKLFDLYTRFNSIDEIDERTRAQLQEKYFKRSFEEVWAETREYYGRNKPEVLAKAEANPKAKMALIFKWYFVHSTRLALSGSPTQRVDYQVHCGPAMGAFNQWVKGTRLENWRNRHVDQIAEKLMIETAALLNRRFTELANPAD